jgi:hypothetical protein
MQGTDWLLKGYFSWNQAMRAPLNFLNTKELKVEINRKKPFQFETVLFIM